MDSKSKKIIIISSIALLLIVIIGVSYAYFVANISGAETTSTIVSNTGNMSITYANGSGNINAENIAPDNNPFATKDFTVTGTNTTTKDMYYVLKLIIDNNTFSEGALTYTLTSTNTSTNGDVV